MTHPTQQLFGTEVHTLQSDAVGDAFEITVAPPPAGTEGPVGVVYFTDATTRIGTAVETVRSLSTTGEIPPLLLVGVGYPVRAEEAPWLRLRTRDFTPVALARPGAVCGDRRNHRRRAGGDGRGAAVSRLPRGRTPTLGARPL